jgi:erythromycin esterase-like protein
MVWAEIENVLNSPEAVMVGLNAQEKQKETVELMHKELDTIDNQLINRQKQKRQIHKAFYITSDEDTFKADIAELNKEEQALIQRESDLEQSIKSFEGIEVDREAILRACEIVRDNVKSLTYEKKRFALEALKAKVNIDGEVITIGGNIGLGNIAFTPA